MATKKKAAPKKAAKKKATKPNVNFTGVIVPDDCQTCTILFLARVSLKPGKPKRVKVMATGDPITKLSVTD
ncbi:MAG TPA: hypothetical protein VLW65_11725 [Bryobacteraceae bacterium]|nr:hypothetical protein [Bryobacteraceae bacterium]